MPSTITLKTPKKVLGEIVLPGSKSLSNRALLLSALSHNECHLHHLLDSDDTHYMREALKLLGITCHFSKDFNESLVKGSGGIFQSSHEKPTELFLGNAGTAMRFLTAVLSLPQKIPQSWILTGEPRMLERPIGDLVDALRQAGANIDYLGQEGFPPLQIKNTKLKGRKITLSASLSSQFISAILMISPFFNEDTYIHLTGEIVSRPYIEMTLKMMAAFGIKAHWQGQDIFIAKGQQYFSPKNYFVEGDASSASYFLAAGAIAGKVTVYGVGKNALQGDVKFAEVLEKMGAKITYGDHFITAEKENLKGIDIDANDFPDAAMTLAPLALFAEGETVIRNIYNWRLKETDRLNAMATELKKIGAVVKEGKDFLRIQPLNPKKFKTASIETYRDHRMAMCFALVSFLGEIHIQDPGCVNKTFPQFFEEWKKLQSSEEK